MNLKLALLCSLLFASVAVCSAQSPTPVMTVTPTPTPTVTPNPPPDPTATPYNAPGDGSPTPAPTPPTPIPIPTPFQAPSPNPLYPTKLEWRVFQPTDGADRWPVVIVLHTGGFKTGSYYDGCPVEAAQDLADAGFYAVVASYPLAPPHRITDQPLHTDPASGRPPQQTDAVKALVNAAKVDSHCLNGLVGILGGSAGGSHAAFVALDTTNVTAWPVWNGDHRPNFVACLSGAYDFADRSDDITGQFQRDIENYTNTGSRLGQWNDSPIAHATSDIIPMYFINSEGDMMPVSQQYYMFNALYHAGASSSLYKMWTIPGNDQHAFAYWDDPIKDTFPQLAGWKVKDRVIGYFNQYLK
jgi:acetyl esterase/lipase